MYSMFNAQEKNDFNIVFIRNMTLVNWVLSNKQVAVSILPQAQKSPGCKRIHQKY